MKTTPTESSWTLFETTMDFAYLGVRADSQQNPDAWKLIREGGYLRIQHAAHEPDGVAVDIASSVLNELQFDRTPTALAAAAGLRACSLREEFGTYGEPQDLEIELRFDSVLTAESPALAAAEACDAIETDHLSVRELARERTVRIFVIVPPSTITREFEEAIRRRHQVTLRNTLADVLTERRPEDRREATRHLPSIIAVPYALSNRPQPSIEQKWIRTAKTAEAAVRYMAALAMARDLRGDRAERVGEILTALSSAKPTLGKWIEIVRTHPAAARDLLPNTAELLWRKRGITEVGAFFFGKYVEDRNSYAHGGLAPDAEFHHLIDRLHEPLQALLETLAEDARVSPLVMRTDFEFSAGNSFDYTLVELRGAGIVLPSSRAVTEQRLDPQKVYLHRSVNEFVEVDPLIICEACSQCGVEEGFLLDRIGRHGPSWLSFRNHTYPKKK